MSRKTSRQLTIENNALNVENNAPNDKLARCSDNGICLNILIFIHDVTILWNAATMKVNAMLIITHSYTPRTLRPSCSQSELMILKICKSSAHALFLYNCTPNTSCVCECSLVCTSLVNECHTLLGSI